jgi:hypothetical protein
MSKKRQGVETMLAANCLRDVYRLAQKDTINQ